MWSMRKHQDMSIYIRMSLGECKMCRSAIRYMYTNILELYTSRVDICVSMQNIPGTKEGQCPELFLEPVILSSSTCRFHMCLLLPTRGPSLLDLISPSNTTLQSMSLLQPLFRLHKLPNPHRDSPEQVLLIS